MTHYATLSGFSTKRCLQTIALLGGLLFSLLCTTAFAQEIDATKLAVQWKLLRNQYEGREEFEAAFVFQNKSKQVFPAKGWRLYFSYPRKVLAVPENQVLFENINGEFCRLVPATSFGALLPGASVSIRYIGRGKAFSRTDAPSGLFIVWDHAPEKAIPIQQYSVDAVPVQEVSTLRRSPGISYEKNKRIRPVHQDSLPLFIPAPMQVNTSTDIFTLTQKTVLSFDPVFANEAALLQTDLATVLGKQPAIAAGGEASVISIKQMPGYPSEGYRLQVHTSGVRIEASSTAGAFYAVQSLKHLLPSDAWSVRRESVRIKTVDIIDAPRFAYRSLMLDVARNFQTKKQVMKIIDLLALYKINTLHFHLTDDEGWRLEIPTLPELTMVGGHRGHTLNEKDQINPAYGSGGIRGSLPGSGYYSKEDFIELLKYATARHIRVIPELETPGHARAVIKAMKVRYHRLMQEGKATEAIRFLLHDTLDQSVYRSVQGYNDNVMNVALPSVYHFIEEVVDQVRSMYIAAGAPLQTIHMGGDEVPSGVWQRSPAVEKLMKQDVALKSTDDLWYYYLGRVNTILRARNLYLSGWEEVGMRKTKLDGKPIYIPNPDFAGASFHTYVWNNVWGWGMEDLAYRLANAGYKVVLSPVTNFYFDLAYEKDVDEPGLYWGGYLDEEKPFYFNPFDYYKTATETPDGRKLDPKIFDRKERLTDYGRSNIVGLQAQIWSEKISSAESLEYMILPKLIGFAERAWAQQPDWANNTDTLLRQQLYQQHWNLFANKMSISELPRLDHFAGGFQYRIPPPGAVVKDGMVQVNVLYPTLMVRYTTDGTEPTVKSPEYKTPIAMTAIVKLAAFNQQGRKSRTITLQHP
jgi:hexosaminidase